MVQLVSTVVEVAVIYSGIFSLPRLNFTKDRWNIGWRKKMAAFRELMRERKFGENSRSCRRRFCNSGNAHVVIQPFSGQVRITIFFSWYSISLSWSSGLAGKKCLNKCYTMSFITMAMNLHSCTVQHTEPAVITIIWICRLFPTAEWPKINWRLVCPSSSSEWWNI